MSRRDAVLEALRSHAQGISGERIACELGVSRTAVAKHIAALREMGYRIDSIAGTGYALRETPDAPLPAEVALFLADERWQLTGGSVTGSTNDDAKALAAAGAGEFTVVLASAQEAGRGRLGRSWASPAGGVYLSVLLRPNVEPARIASLSLGVALGVSLGLERLGAAPAIKWPNDVRLECGKVAGVLIEIAAESDRVAWVVAGLGVNVRAVGEREPGATYLADVVPGVCIPQVAAAVLDGIASTYDTWTGRGFGGLRSEFECRSALTGDAVVVRDMTGALVAEGVVTGVDAEGRLVLDGPQGESSVSAGEVTLR